MLRILVTKFNGSLTLMYRLIILLSYPVANQLRTYIHMYLQTKQTIVLML